MDPEAPEQDIHPRSRRLHRLAMVRAGPSRVEREDRVMPPATAPLSDEGRDRVAALTRRWEWAEIVVSSPLRRARETAAILARGAPVQLDVNLRPRELGRWGERTVEELRVAYPDAYEAWMQGGAFDLPGAEPFATHTARTIDFLERAVESPCFSMLVVAHRSTIRAIADALVAPLPPGRPLPAEMVLLTRQDEGRWALGRRTSDPPDLRSPLERTGLSEEPDARPSDRHVARLEVPGAAGT